MCLLEHHPREVRLAPTLLPLWKVSEDMDLSLCLGSSNVLNVQDTYTDCDVSCLMVLIGFNNFISFVVLSVFCLLFCVCFSCLWCPISQIWDGHETITTTIDWQFGKTPRICQNTYWPTNEKQGKSSYDWDVSDEGFQNDSQHAM